MDILSTSQAAEHLGMARSTFARWVWTYHDPARRCKPVGYVGRSPYWTRDVLDKWKQENHCGPGRPPAGRPAYCKTIKNNMAQAAATPARLDDTDPHGEIAGLHDARALVNTGPMRAAIRAVERIEVEG